MKKNTVILIFIIVILSFGALVYHGLRHARGVPVALEEEEKKVVLKVPVINKNIDLTKGIPRDVWNSLPSQEIKLMHQVMVLPWGRSLVSPITIKAFHNNRDIYFYMKWRDTTENRKLEGNKFSDACAVMFPMGDEVQPSTLMMGFLGKANIWQWKAIQDSEYWFGEHPKLEAYVDFYYPFEEKELFTVSKTIPKSAANDLMAIRVGTITQKEEQNVHGRGVWNNGTWEVIFKRSLYPLDPELDAVFGHGEKRLCAFAVWEGESGDRGGRKSISDWVELDIQ